MPSQVTTQHHRGSATIFKNPLLERLTKTSLRQNIIVYGTVIGALIYYALAVVKIPILEFVGLFVFALFFWTFAEYILHRYLFHWISDNEFVQRFHFVMHGSHHLYPRDKERLLMPPVPGLLMASVLFLIFFSIFSLLDIGSLTWAFFPGFFLGYLLYSFVHRATHVAKPPKRFKHIWRHHSLHHFKYPDKAFGVSTTFWDRVFGTMPPRDK
jgi:sterol desaturase/sphingolipid hydroxylase (fatty acid hydroxylase superfamily)